MVDDNVIKNNTFTLEEFLIEYNDKTVISLLDKISKFINVNNLLDYYLDKKDNEVIPDSLSNNLFILDIFSFIFLDVNILYRDDKFYIKYRTTKNDKIVEITKTLFDRLMPGISLAYESFNKEITINMLDLKGYDIDVENIILSEKNLFLHVEDTNENIQEYIRNIIPNTSYIIKPVTTMAISDELKNIIIDENNKIDNPYINSIIYKTRSRFKHMLNDLELYAEKLITFFTNIIDKDVKLKNALVDESVTITDSQNDKVLLFMILNIDTYVNDEVSDNEIKDFLSISKNKIKDLANYYNVVNEIIGITDYVNDKNNDLNMQLENVAFYLDTPLLEAVDLGTPILYTRTTTLLKVPNADGINWNYLIVTFQSYGHGTEVIIINTVTKQIQNIKIDDYANWNMPRAVIAPNGKLYINTMLNPHLRQTVSVYDPVTDELKVHEIELPESISGETNPMTLGPDGLLYATGSYYLDGVCTGRAALVSINPDTHEVIDYGMIGPVHDDMNVWGYFIGVDRKYVYVSSGKTPWYLIAVDIETKEQEVLLSGEEMTVTNTLYGVLVTHKTEAYDRYFIRDKILYRFDEYSEEITIDEGTFTFLELYRSRLVPDNLPPEREINDSDEIHPDRLTSFWYKNDNDDWEEFKYTSTVYEQPIGRLFNYNNKSLLISGYAYTGYSFLDVNTLEFIYQGRLPLSNYALGSKDDFIYLSGYPSSMTYKFNVNENWTAGLPTEPTEDEIRYDNPNLNPVFLEYYRAYSGVHKVFSICITNDDTVFLGGRWYRDGNGGGLTWFKVGDEHNAEGMSDIFSNYQIRYMSLIEDRYLAISTLAVDDYVLNKPTPLYGRIFIFDTITKNIVRSFDPIPLRSTGFITTYKSKTLGEYIVGVEYDNTLGYAYIYSVDIYGNLRYKIKFEHNLNLYIGDNEPDPYILTLAPDNTLWFITKSSIMMSLDPDSGRLRIVGHLSNAVNQITFIQNMLFGINSEHVFKINISNLFIFPTIRDTMFTNAVLSNINNDNVIDTMLNNDEQIPEIPTVEYTIPVRSNHSGVLIPVLHKDRDKYNFIQIYFRSYGIDTEYVIINPTDNIITNNSINEYANWHLIKHVTALNGKTFMIGSGAPNARTTVNIYDPDTMSIETDAIELPEGFGGETRPVTLGTTGTIFIGASSFGSGQAQIVSIDSDTYEVTDYGKIGIVHTDGVWGYGIAADDEYVYIVSGKVPWQLIAVNIETKEQTIIMTSYDVITVYQKRYGVMFSNVGRYYNIYKEEIFEEPLRDYGDVPWPMPEGVTALDCKDSTFETDNLPVQPETFNEQLIVDYEGNGSLFIKNENSEWDEYPFIVNVYEYYINRFHAINDENIICSTVDYGGFGLLNINTGDTKYLGNIHLSHYTSYSKDDIIYLSGYAGGRLFRYDYSKEWTQMKRLNPDEEVIDEYDSSHNPRLTNSLGSSSGIHKTYDSCEGSDGNIYFGGRWYRDGNGGGLTWFNPVDFTEDGISDIFSNYQIRYMCSGYNGRFIVISTMAVDDITLFKPTPLYGRIFIFDTKLKEIVRQIDPVKDSIETGIIFSTDIDHITGFTISNITGNLIMYKVNIHTMFINYNIELPFDGRFIVGTNIDIANIITKDKNNNLWLIGENRVLLKINPDTLEITQHGKVPWIATSLIIVNDNLYTYVKNNIIKLNVELY